MNITRWNIISRTNKHMVWPLFCAFMVLIEIPAYYLEKPSEKEKIFSILGIITFATVYCFYSQGYVLDVLFKSIKVTPPITAENITLGGHIEGVARGKFFGGGFTVTDSNGKSVDLKLYNDALDTKLGVEFKFYYLKRSKVVVGAETLRFNKKVDQSRKGRKSK